MIVNWTDEDELFHEAECRSEGGRIVRLLVEGLGEHGWGWQVHEPADARPMRYGVVDTLGAAKVRAELELVDWLRERERGRERTG